MPVIQAMLRYGAFALKTGRKDTAHHMLQRCCPTEPIERIQMATPEELLAKLEERFILDDISEASYHELKAKLRTKLGRDTASSPGGQSIGEGNVIKGDISNTTGAASVGNVVFNVPSASEGTSPSLLQCPICGQWKKLESVFSCRLCGQDNLCLDHFDAAAHACKQCSAKETDASVGGRNAEDQRQLPPASFATHVTSLTTQAMMALGGLGGFSDTNSEKVMVDLELAKHHIDTLIILEAKTKGNLDQEEVELMELALYQAQAKFVEVAQHLHGQQS